MSRAQKACKCLSVLFELGVAGFIWWCGVVVDTQILKEIDGGWLFFVHLLAVLLNCFLASVLLSRRYRLEPGLNNIGKFLVGCSICTFCGVVWPLFDLALISIGVLSGIYLFVVALQEFCQDKEKEHEELLREAL